jgi:hypothetical protein
MFVEHVDLDKIHEAFEAAMKAIQETMVKKE